VMFSASCITDYQKNNMTIKPYSELSFQERPETLECVEIDTGSIPETERIQTIRSVLARYARANPAACATAYSCSTVSFSFREITHAEFIGVVGAPQIVEALHTSLEALPDARVCYGNLVDTRDAKVEGHIQDGQLWLPDDAVNCCAFETTWSGEAWPDPVAEVDEEVDEEEGEAEQDESEQKAPTRMRARYRAARADASIGSIRHQIETLFGLPEGSVALCGPEGNALRADARIKTLRRRWGW
jgi:hypothetical protein